jgi:hypothetical protein
MFGWNETDETADRADAEATVQMLIDLYGRMGGGAKHLGRKV